VNTPDVSESGGSVPGTGVRQDLPFALNFLRLVLALLMVGCILGALVAVALVVGGSSMAGSGEGHGLITGLALLGLCVIVPVLLAVGALLWQLGRSPVAAARLTVVAGLALCLFSLFIAPTLGMSAAGCFLGVGLPISVLGAVGAVQLRRP
jgi:hypothetical protein